MYNMTSFVDTLTVLPNAEELLRRYAVLLAVDKEFGTEMLVLKKNFNGCGSDLFFWEDGGGDEAYVVFKADGVNDDSVLAFTYDYGSDFNFGGMVKQNVFADLPESFKHLFSEPALNESGFVEPVATGAAWLVSGDPVWKFSSVFAEQFNTDNGRNDMVGIFVEILDIFSFDPTVENLVELFYEYFYFERSRNELAMLIEQYVKGGAGA